jgi:hypothetical protein
MIDSILFPRHKAQWRKFTDEEVPAQLHRKFWVQGEYNNLFNVDEEAAEEAAEEATEATMVVEDTAEDDEDVGPECHVLDLGIPHFGRSKLWVRKEYIRMYK